MASSNPKLGQDIHQMLVGKGIENPISFGTFRGYNVDSLNNAFSKITGMLGMSTTDPSTEGTPKRLAKMYKNEICFGLDYDNFPECMVTPNDGKLDEIVLVQDITVTSLCEHHFMPVMGRAHVAYIPKDKLLGLSKFNRVVEFFARRPQLQERMGQQILATFQYLLDTEDVAVVISAEHLCVKFRGIQDQCSSTTTSHMAGRFRAIPEVRAELLSLIALGGKR